LIVGPLFYSWPENKAMIARPRFGIGIQGLVSPLAQYGWHRTLQAASLIICATHKQAMAMQKQFPQAKVLHLPVIVDPPSSESPLIRKAPDESGVFRLLFVANLVPSKNPLVFCQAIKLLRDGGIYVKAMLLGEGSERPTLEAYCASHGLGDIVWLQGKVSNSEVYHHLRDSDLLVSTSLGEPYGRSIVEAMSVGTPCICHNSGGPAEIIEHEVDGLLVQELNAKAFADSIALVLANPQLWQRLSNSAISKAKNWTSDIVLSRLEQALLQVCSTRNS
jgi:glycosyltransferase involved in cell wall biosynthesis